MKLKLIISILFLFNISASQIAKILKKYNIKESQVGISTYDINTKITDNIVNADKAFIPASTFKVISAYYLLKNNDPQKVFTTQLLTTGEVKDGVLNGNIIIRSSGNPYFLTTNLYNLLYSLKSKKIKEIKGKIILEGEFEAIHKIGEVGLDDQSYNQSLSSFNINFNRFRLFNSGEFFYYLPKINALKINKTSKELPPGEVVSHNGKANLESWSYQRTTGNRHEIPVRNSELFYSSYVEKILNNLEVKITKEDIKSTPETLLTQDSSVKFERLVELALEYSNNLFMEVLLLETAKEKDLKSAALKMKLFLGEDFKNIKIENASGLSTDLFIEPKLFTSFLGKIFNEKIRDKYFFSYLSLAGSTGFISNRFLGQDIHEKFFAKTGSLDYVNNICGISFKNGERSFCIFINDFEKRKTLQGVNSKNLEDLRQKAKLWKKETDQLIDELITEIL